MYVAERWHKHDGGIIPVYWYETHEPAQEETVALGLLVVGIVAHIEQNVGVGAEELNDNAHHRYTGHLASASAYAD